VSWLALDIGGANIKVADGLGYCASEAFALWREPARLGEVLGRILTRAPACNHIAATMTGELADCFATKEEGVRHILAALQSAADKIPIWVYQTTGRLEPLDKSLLNPMLAAAANWHVLARFAGRFAPTGAAILVDIGSTTTDLIPLIDGRPHSRGIADTERLLTRELVYTGVERSPVCALVRHLPYREQLCPVAQELFATTGDAYLTLNELAEQPENTNTADGRSATREAARARLARSICADPTTFDAADAHAAAAAIRRRQVIKIAAAVAKIPGPLEPRADTIILSGAGEFLARRVLKHIGSTSRVVSLAEELGPGLSRCAPAHALAVLAREGIEP